MPQWDERKRASNLRKHGWDFAQVEKFDFETAYVCPDESDDHEEFRQAAIGFVGVTLCFLVYVEQEDDIRVVSLRRATKREIGAYNDYARSMARGS